MDNQQIASALRALREGDLSVRLPEDDAATRDLARAYNALAEQSLVLTREIAHLCDDMVRGRFGGQIEIPGATGAWSQLAGDVNLASITLTVQIRSVAMVAALKASGDTETRITVQAEGETKELIDSVNSIGGQPLAAGI